MYTSIFYKDDNLNNLDFFKKVVSEINELISFFLDLNMPVKSGFDVLKEISVLSAFKEFQLLF